MTHHASCRRAWAQESKDAQVHTADIATIPKFWIAVWQFPAVGKLKVSSARAWQQGCQWKMPYKQLENPGQSRLLQQSGHPALSALLPELCVMTKRTFLEIRFVAGYWRQFCWWNYTLHGRQGWRRRWSQALKRSRSQTWLISCQRQHSESQVWSHWDTWRRVRVQRLSGRSTSSHQILRWTKQSSTRRWMCLHLNVTFPVFRLPFQWFALLWWHLESSNTQRSLYCNAVSWSEATRNLPCNRLEAGRESPQRQKSLDAKSGLRKQDQGVCQACLLYVLHLQLPTAKLQRQVWAPPTFPIPDSGLGRGGCYAQTSY